jgi:hypothetical protein
MGESKPDEESTIENNNLIAAPSEKSRINPLDDWERPTGLVFILIYMG